MGQSRPFGALRSTSGMASIADIARASANVREVPQAAAGSQMVDAGCPTTMLMGERVGTTSVISNPLLVKRSWNS